VNEILQDIVLVILGALLALVSGRLLEHYKERKQRQVAFQRLDSMLLAVRQAVAHDHNFKNKADWYKELDDLAKVDRAWLGQLYEPIKQIAWRVRDQSFDHDKADAAEYCCDELIMDLSLLQLKLLPLILMRRDRREATARALARTILINWYGTLSFDPAADEQYVDRFLKDWAEDKVTVNSKYAMSSVLGVGVEK